MPAKVKLTKWLINKKENRNFPLYETQSDAYHSVKLLWHFPKILTGISQTFTELSGENWQRILEASYSNRNFYQSKLNPMLGASQLYLSLYLLQKDP